ncbi:MAG: hypothetical protein IJU23_00020 [Proteobacteria bacterium]|nr:hypothetical protein [Pseudomonadota bacterium]
MRKNWACLGALLLAACVASCDDNGDNSCTVSTCLGNVAQVCKNGVIESMACPIGCRDGACINANDFCVDNARRCKDALPQFCSGQQWHDLAACPSGTVCSEGNCVNPVVIECKESEVRCYDGKELQNCVGGKWNTKETCPTGYACIVDKCVKLGTSCNQGDKKCSDSGIPQVCDANGKWIDRPACSGNMKCRNGSCESTICWKTECKADETCVNHRCVPNWELTTAAGTKCDPDTWVDYCSDKGEVVSCAVKTGVYRTKCELGCKVTDLSIAMDGKTWIPAFCDTKWSELCTGFTSEIPYCTSEVTANGKMYFEATYQCFPAYGGGYLGFDYGDAGYYELCTNKCDDNKEHCADLKCEVEDSCKQNVLAACSKGKMEDIDCTEYDMFCREYSYNDRKYADCFDANDECQVLEDVKMACAYKNSVGELSLWKCLKPDNSTDQKLYWVKTKVVNCENGCNNTKDGCGD